jgi:calmodulin
MSPTSEKKTKPAKATGERSVDRITEQQLFEFKEAFRQFDSDGSGNIDAEELRKLVEWVRHEPIPDNELVEMMRLADADGSGTVDFWEFATLMAVRWRDARPSTPSHAPRGLLPALLVLTPPPAATRSDPPAQHMMGDTQPQKTLQNAFNVFDSNGDGTIDVQELRNVMREMGENVSEKDINRVLSSIDNNADGLISYEEFADVVCREMKQGGYV